MHPHPLRASVARGLALLASLWLVPAVGAEPGLSDAELSQAVEEIADQARREADEEDDFDPYAGMDEDGRIPSVDKRDVPNPERWRYIPEGRIKPGNIFQRFLVSSFIAPFIFADSDIGTGFGLAITDIDFRKQRRREFAGTFLSYTTKGQQNYSFVWNRWLHHLDLPEGGVLQEERSFVRASGGYSKTLTRRFYGFGPNTNDFDETSYTDASFGLDIGLEHAFPLPGDDFVVGGGISFETHNLSSGKVSDVPSMEANFLQTFVAGDDHIMGWLEWEARYDTRDSQANPYAGFDIRAKIRAAVLQSGGDVGVRYTIDGSKVYEMPGLFHRGGVGNEEHPPTDVVAIAFRTDFTSGDLPFYSLPSLGGGDRLRGYISGRFRDRAAWFVPVEYRFWILPRGFPIPWTDIRIERLGAAAFYEIGQVAPGVTDFFKARVRHSYGVSIRISLERQAPFRIDFGFSEEGSNISASFGLSF